MHKEIQKELIDFANQLADAAAEITMRYYRKPYGHKLKSDSSVVTEIDVMVETRLQEMVKQTYPEHGMIGEELGSFSETAEYIWVIDPIDGTESFLIGRPIFGTLVALLHNQSPVLGIIDQPILKDRWVGVGDKTLFNNTEVKTTTHDKLEGAILCTTSKDYFSAEKLELFESVRKKVKRCIYGGDCYSYGLLASGHVDLVIESGLKLYDYAALVPIIKGAGGVITDWNGCKLANKQEVDIIAAANRELHEIALECLVIDGI